MLKILKVISIPLITLLLSACDNPLSIKQETTALSAADSCFLTTGMMRFQNGIPISGVTAEHFNCVKYLADSGDQQAQWLLVNFYNNGTFVEPSPAMYSYWLRMLANAGDITAKNLLAIAYYNGHGVQKNVSKSIELFTELYQQGHLPNPNIYSLALLTSHNPQQNWPIAKEILLKGLEEDALWAYEFLPYIYLNDFYLPKDIPQAITLFEKGRELGLKHFNIWLGLMYLSGNGVAQDFKIAQTYFDESDFPSLYKVIIKDLQIPYFSAQEYQDYPEDPLAALRKAMIYEAEQNYESAFQEYKIAAKSNHYLAYKKIEEFLNKQYVTDQSIDLSRLPSKIEDTRKIFLNEIIHTQSIVMILHAFAKKDDKIALELLDYYEKNIQIIKVP